MLDTRLLDPDVTALALHGLTRTPKTLPPLLFYDDEGCRLFGAITRLPEYYLTRTEHGILARHGAEMAALAPAGAALIEYGASDEAKALRLLDAPGARFAAYVPIDVAGEALDALRDRLARSHPTLAVYPVEADFLQALRLPEAVRDLPRLGFFPGSTIGNLDPEAATFFLARARATLGDASLVVGFDLRKDPSLLLPAYDDAAGVTAAFNLNLLARLNREAGADFDLDGFAHRAVWNEAQGRIEMHLVSRGAQRVTLGGTRLRFAAGETIHTENSYKYRASAFTAMAERAGWRYGPSWADAAGLFSVHALRPG